MRSSLIKVLEEIRTKRNRRLMASRFDTEEDGWFTGESGQKIHLNERGEIDKGNPHLLAAVAEKGAKLSSGAEKKAEKAGGGRSKLGGAKSTTAKTRSGVAFPKPKDGVEYADDIARIEDEFQKDIANEKNVLVTDPGRFDEVVASLTEDDIVYQTGPDGKEYASIPRLAAMIDNSCGDNKVMQDIFDRAYADGEQITEDMLQVAKDGGFSLTGLENAVKGASHIIKKAGEKYDEALHALELGYAHKYIDDATKTVMTPEQIAGTFGDVVRYSVMTTNQDYVDSVNKTVDSLKEKGYEITEVDNKFLGDDGKENLNATYRAVHIQATAPNGRSIEIQVQSHDMLDVKNINHPLYDESKAPGTSAERKAELNQQMIKNWNAGYKNPPGIEKIKTFKNKS